MGEHPRAHFAIQREAVHTRTNRQHEHRRRAVHRITCCNLRGAGQKKGLLGDFTHCFRRFEHRKNGADGYVDVDIGRPIKRIEQQQIFALWIAIWNLVNRLHLLARHAREMAAPLVGLHQDVVRDDVELFLDFALNILSARAAEHAGQRTFADVHRDGLAGASDDFDQEPQFGLDGVRRPLLFNQKLGQRGATHGRGSFHRIRIHTQIVALWNRKLFAETTAALGLIGILSSSRLIPFYGSMPSKCWAVAESYREKFRPAPDQKRC